MKLTIKICIPISKLWHNMDFKMIDPDPDPDPPLSVLELTISKN